MRVIAGSARRLLLKTPQGMETRPTQDRIKETLFNMLMNDVPGSRFLDLFAGSGAMGIEALSRGAREAVFIDSGKEPVACIKDNLKHTHLEDRGVVIERDVFMALASMNGKAPFDIILMDPPYNKELEKKTLMALRDNSIANEDTIIIIEASLDTNIDYLNELSFELVKEKLYKTNKHIFVKKI